MIGALLPQDSSGSLRPLLLALSLSSLGIGVSLPIVPLIALELQASGLVVGIIVATRWASRLLADIPLGTASERRGRRVVFVSGICLVAVSGIASAMAPSWEWLLLARVVEGIGAGGATTAGLAAVADLSTPASRGRYLASYQASQRIGFWFGPLIGGYVATAIDLRAALWVYAALAIAAVGPALLVRESRQQAPVLHASPLAALRVLARDRDFRLISAVSFVVFFTLTGAQLTALPLFTSEQLGYDPAFVGWALFISNTVGFILIYPSGYASDRYGRRAVIIVLMASMAVGLAMLAVSTTAAWIIVACVVLGGGNALRGPAMQAYVMDAGRASGHGATAGAFRAVGDLGSTLGPVAATAILGVGYGAFFALNALLTVAVLIPFSRLASARPGAARPTPIGASDGTETVVNSSAD